MFATIRQSSRNSTRTPVAFRLDILPLKTRKRFSAGSEEEDAGKGNSILCANCSHPVTSPEFRTLIAGTHEHAFFNPAGVIYEIGCFRQAPGVYAEGFATEEFTWFAGYQWQIALCKICRTHLGWLYSGRDDFFYGLIRSRLIEKSG